MCIVFGHKIKEIKLFTYKNNDGVLGYVNHSYNPKNIYHKIGNYFIGIAPILVGSLFLAIALNLLIPRTYNNLYVSLYDIVKLQGNGSFIDVFQNEFLLTIDIFNTILIQSKHDYKWIIFIFISICISLHMSLSNADIKHSIPALPYLISIIILFNLILGFISSKIYLKTIKYILFGCAYLLFSISISLIIAIIFLISLIIIKNIFKLLKRNKLFNL